jgi:preprotein translocase subunit SecA
VDRGVDPAEWRLDALAGKIVQYCRLLEGLTGDTLRAEVGPATRPSPP